MAKFSKFIIFVLATIFSSPSISSEASVIKWLKVCSYENDSAHIKWIIGLHNGSKLWAYYNPEQGRSALYSLVLSAYMAEKPISHFNAELNTQTVCGEVATHFIDINKNKPAIVMVGEK